MTPGKLYTPAEANEMLPHVAPALVELREKYEHATRIRDAMANAAGGNGGSTRREKWDRVLARVAELFDRLQQWEIELRDISTGLIDFPAVIGDEEVWLCWRLGEPEVAFWHPRDEGFAGRRPLPGV